MILSAVVPKKKNINTLFPRIWFPLSQKKKKGLEKFRVIKYVQQFSLSLPKCYYYLIRKSNYK